MPMVRPDIADIRTGIELKKWYWLKSELVTFAKEKHLHTGGAKFTILEIIANSLDGIDPTTRVATKPTSKFDWDKEELTLETVITDSYKNRENVRIFFKQHCGVQFAFSIPFMDWMKKNTGKTLRDAVLAWEILKKTKQQKDFKSTIPQSNQYNQYLRDFFADNPEKTMQEARDCWQQKRSLPLERHVYEREDLKLTEQ